MTNVQGPRSLSGTFVPFMPPPTDLAAAPDGAGGVVIGWSPPDTILPIAEYSIYMTTIGPDGPTGFLEAECPGSSGYPDHNPVTSCLVPGYQTGTVYVVDVRVSDGWGFPGHQAHSSSQELVQIATVDLPEGQATLRTLGEPPPQNDSQEPRDLGNMCLIFSAPVVLTPSAAELAEAGAPSGSTAPLGALQLEVKGCAGKTLKVAVDYPAGALSGLQSWTRHGSEWQTEGSIQGNTIHYSFSVPSLGDPGELTLKAAAPGDISVTLAPLALAAGPGPDGVQPVPTLGQWSVLLLSVLAGLLGWRMRWRRST